MNDFMHCWLAAFISNKIPINVTQSESLSVCLTTTKQQIPDEKQSGCTYLHETALFLGEEVQAVEIEGVLGDGGALRDGRAPLLHEVQQLVEEGPPTLVAVHLVEPRQRVRLRGVSMGGGGGALKCVLSIVTYDILRHSLNRGLLASNCVAALESRSHWRDLSLMQF